MRLPETVKGWLRPLIRPIRRRIKRPVFHIRRWQAKPRLERADSVDGSFNFQFLWRSTSPKYAQLVVESEFTCRQNYPTGAEPIPLIEVFTRTGKKYLSLAHCPATGLVFHNCLPALEWQHEYYTAAWDRALQRKDPIDPERLIKTRTNKMERLVGSLIGGRSRVLDVGCGYGDQLLYFRKKGHEVCGIEPSQHRAEFARRLLDSEILNCPVEGNTAQEQLSARGQLFDLIYLNQVLEHLHDPLAVVKLLRPFLSDNGILVIGVPDYFCECLANYFCSIVHTHCFTVNALQNILGLAGYRCKADLSFPGYLYFAFKRGAGDQPTEADPQTAKVIRYACSHFDLTRNSPQAGGIISIVSTYTGYTETGLRVIGASRAHDFRRALKRGDLGQVREFLPVSIVTPFDQPTIWQK